MKLKQFITFMAMVTILSLMIAGCGSSATNNNTEEDGSKESKPVTLKLSTYFPNTSTLYIEIIDPWMKRVTELTNGQVKIEPYPGEQLGKAGDQLQLTKDGVVHLSVLPASYFPDNMPLGNMLSGMPNNSQNSIQATLAFNDLLKESPELIETDYTKNGVTPILTNVSPAYEVWTINKEVRIPKDLKGLKVRTPGGVANEMYQGMGVVPVTVSHTETYEALEKGVIDAVSYSHVALTNSGTDELVTNVIYPHIGTAMQTLVINDKAWKGLSESAQKAMKQAAEEILKPSSEAYEEITKKVEEEFIKAGGKKAELTKEEQQQWDKISNEFTDKWLKDHKSDGHPYDKVLKLYKEKLEKYK